MITDINSLAEKIVTKLTIEVLKIKCIICYRRWVLFVHLTTMLSMCLSEFQAIQL